MNIEFLGFTLDIAGKVLVALTVIAVHRRFREEHRVDEKVFRAMRREQLLGVIGIALMLLGYALQAPGKF